MIEATGNRILPSVAPTRSLPVIRGIQAGREYYMAMCHLGFIAKNLPFPPENLPPEKVIQRQVNKGRIPRISEYLVKYHDDYVLPPIIASIDGDATFQPLSTESENLQVGILHISETADFIINDGQHRCAAIKQALDRKPSLRMETLGVVFYLDRGVKRSRQMFADLNGHPVRTNQNINTTFESREYLPEITKDAIDMCPLLENRVELFASGCAIGSPRVFTVSAIAKAHRVLLNEVSGGNKESDLKLCRRFWDILKGALPEAGALVADEVTGRYIKETYFYPYSIALQALASVANHLIRTNGDEWEDKLAEISTVNWRRDNREWENRAMSGGRLTTGGSHPILTLNLIKKKLRIDLTPDEKRVEKHFRSAVKSAKGI